MNKKDKWFIGIAVLTAVSQFAFVFWMGFPGYIHERGQSYKMMFLG